jgi:hypothetical protein
MKVQDAGETKISLLGVHPFDVLSKLPEKLKIFGLINLDF